MSTRAHVALVWAERILLDASVMLPVTALTPCSIRTDPGPRSADVPETGDWRRYRGTSGSPRAASRLTTTRHPARPLVGIDTPVPQPAHSRDPAARRPHRRRPRRGRRRCPPPGEPRRGRPRIETARSRDVLPPVLQHVDQRVPDLPRRAEQPRVVAIAPHCPAPPENPVHGLRHPHSEPLAPPGEARRALRLDEEMQVIRLDAEVQHPERPPGGRCQGERASCEPRRR